MASFIPPPVGLNLILPLLFLADRATKFLALAKLPGREIILIPNWFQLSIYKNFNVAFGWRFSPAFLYPLIIFILCWLLIFWLRAWRQKDNQPVFWLGLIIIGALSNFIDRLLYGYVVDFIEVPWWSIFNLADIMIVIGIGGWLIKNVKIKNQNGK